MLSPQADDKSSDHKADKTMDRRSTPDRGGTELKDREREKSGREHSVSGWSLQQQGFTLLMKNALIMQ